MAENINEKIEEQEVIVENETSVAKDILGYVKENWWKGLIGIGTAAVAFCAGVLVAGRDQQEPIDVAADIPEAAPFDLDTGVEL